MHVGSFYFTRETVHSNGRFLHEQQFFLLCLSGNTEIHYLSGDDILHSETEESSLQRII